MKAKTFLTTLVLLIAIWQPARGITFESWRESYFTPAQIADPLIGGPDADPDGDKIANFA